MMFYLFHNKNVMPAQFYNMSIGEKIILRAFVEEEMKVNEKNKNPL